MRRFALCALLCVGCSSGDFGVAASADDTSVAPTDGGDDGSSSEGGGDAPVGDACNDDTFCADKCGLGLIDACGARRDCATDCGADKICDGVTHKCLCNSVPKDVWCKNRCGKSNDNCGRDVACGECVTGFVCTLGACGCTPDSDAVTCAKVALTCGSTKNNCDQTVSCGACPVSQACTAGKCCDLKSTTCAGKCGSVVDNCGATVDCGGCSGTGRTCCKNKCTNTTTDFANCGGCGVSCASITHADTCESGGCTCAGHGANTDSSHCGPCSSGATMVSMDCIAGGRSKCTNGICF